MTIFFLSILDAPGAAKQIGELYKKAESNLPSNATTNANALSTNINNLESAITKQRPVQNLSPSEKFVVNQIDKVKNLIQNDKDYAVDSLNDDELEAAQYFKAL